MPRRKVTRAQPKAPMTPVETSSDTVTTVSEAPRDLTPVAAQSAEIDWTDAEKQAELARLNEEFHKTLPATTAKVTGLTEPEWQEITPDLWRRTSTDPLVFEERMTFRGCTGYDVGFEKRAEASIKRAFDENNPKFGHIRKNMPVFNEANEIIVRVEVRAKG